MTGKTHIVGGLLVGLLLTQALDIQTGYAALAGIGALIPDIDEPHSTIGRKIPGSFLIKFLFGHREFWHSLLAAGLFYLLLLGFGSNIVAMLFVAGYISHLLLDALTPSGVPFLFPKQHSYSLNLMRTGGIVEYIFLLALVIVTVYCGTGGVV